MQNSGDQLPGKRDRHLGCHNIANPVTGDVETYTFNKTTGAGTVVLGDIRGVNQECIPNVKKAILQLHCTGEGNVNILITGISGIDENTGKSIPSDNIQMPICPSILEQIPFEVELINPIECNNYYPGEEFAVKAGITNGSDNDLNGVTATLNWNAGAWSSWYWTDNLLRSSS